MANPSGARLMTRDTGTNTWYWVTWEVTASNAYFHFLAGTIATTNPTIYQGPENWSWGKNAWAFQYDKYPLRPGGNLLFARNGDNGGDNKSQDTKTTSDATETYEFYDRFSGSR
jgi:hypothetical protein